MASNDKVRDSYDSMANQYTAFVLGDLDRVPTDRRWLTTFADLVVSGDDDVLDLGCGPGHIVDHLGDLGLSAIGYDISSKLLKEALAMFPNCRFGCADFGSLPHIDASIAGIIARYSLIHTEPARLNQILVEWSRVLQIEAPLLISFFAAASPEDHGLAFDHAIVKAYQLFPQTIIQQLSSVGFGRTQLVTRRPLQGERPLDHATILAQKI